MHIFMLLNSAIEKIIIFYPINKLLNHTQWHVFTQADDFKVSAFKKRAKKRNQYIGVKGNFDFKVKFKFT